MSPITPAQDHSEALRQIRNEIPKFGVSRIHELHGAFKHYRDLMHHIITIEEYKVASYLSQHTPFIDHHILHALNTKNLNEKKEAFDTAVTNLVLDIDYLLGIIGFMKAQKAIA